MNSKGGETWVCLSRDYTISVLGHQCWHPRPCIMASTDVFVNGRGVNRVGDMWMVHCCHSKCHPGKTARGSSSVFANGKPVGRIKDAISCGSKIMTGSSNVFAG